MKSYTLILFVILCTSCRQSDKINHYLNKKVTELELVENGFYKYTYADTIREEDDIDGPIGTIFRYELYSNVKPQKQDNGKLYPVPLFKINQNLDNVQKEERRRYISEELNNRIITYYFVNDTLRSKYIYVYSIDKNNKKIADLTSEKSILNYYKNQKVPFKQRLGGKKYGINKIEFPYRFRINNYESGIYILKSNQDSGYQMVTTYQDVKENEETRYDFRPINPDNVEHWYNGTTFELSK
ncbi:hypothetical protein KHA90_09100 [Flavobacterium psychroterrae]|uniref:Lipoprotein n=1 Tax=Flavobacterium psychroterrae TaxID=2133767 RepID=A0ABS5PA41_9FLAO|nr:hypothetical protein [Flavobacterium psychroterrae]MBS7231182.1 hypothetical protein [Flavobacterium psychroterrae]